LKSTPTKDRPLLKTGTNSVSSRWSSASKKSNRVIDEHRDEAGRARRHIGGPGILPDIVSRGLDPRAHFRCCREKGCARIEWAPDQVRGDSEW
jgi:hypothetical protein